MVMRGLCGPWTGRYRCTLKLRRYRLPGTQRDAPILPNVHHHATGCAARGTMTVQYEIYTYHLYQLYYCRNLRRLS